MHSPSRAFLLLTVGTALSVSLVAQDRRGGRRSFGRRPPDAVMQALDQDQDRALSKPEIEGAVEQLLSLDRNGDGNITFDELTPPRGDRGGRGGGRGGFGGAPGMLPGRMNSSPIVTALDKDGDNELFEDEVTDAAKSLLALDEDGNGQISAEELPQPTSRFGRRGPGGGRGGFPGFGRGGRDGGSGRTLLPDELEFEDGVATLPDRQTFERLSYQGEENLVDAHLNHLQYVKYQIEGANGDDPKVYFINTKTHRGHPMFMGKVGIQMLGRRGGEGAQMRGVLVFRPLLKSPSGNTGLYTYEYEPNDRYSYEMVKRAQDLLEEHSPLLKGNLAYTLLPASKEKYLEEKDKYAGGDIALYDPDDAMRDVGFLPLHKAKSFGRLRLMDLEERPSPRDIVLYRSLPNEMPRVAGIITGFRQTPLSHVNLRAVQDDVPNAFIQGAADNAAIRKLVGRYVAYSVTDEGFILREAAAAEVEQHFADLRPTKKQFPPRDLTMLEIRAFDQVGFDDAKNVGVKAANLAMLRTFGLRDDLTPNGFAVPFSFYEAFMRFNQLDKAAEAMMARKAFRTDASVRETELARLRKAIKKGRMPEVLSKALGKVQARFPEKTSIRCRSSTNNEDLPGFSGAGLYDSFTHHPEEGRIDKSIQQVFASLWNFRAFEEREFYRIDHSTAAMGVVLHANTAGEQANGVAVTKDILYGTKERLGVRYYVNAQAGEDLVTNPGADSIPEEILLSPRNPRRDQVMQSSNRTQDGAPVLSDAHRLELRRCLRTVQEKFGELYGKQVGEDFAMEVEFKLLANGKLFIKQARPWVD